jgi:hypothetical protein
MDNISSAIAFALLVVTWFTLRGMDRPDGRANRRTPRR